MQDFLVGCIEQDQCHPDFGSSRVALFILVKKPPHTKHITLQFACKLGIMKALSFTGYEFLIPRICAL
jgi:hypothetical protein